MRFKSFCLLPHLLAFSAILSLGCKSAPTPAKTETLNQGPVSLAEILAEPHPIESYAETFSAISFESNSQLTVGAEAQGQNYRGHTLFKRNENGDFILVREPLQGGEPTEVRLIGGRAYVLSAARPGFVRTREQPEFQRWANEAFREVFRPFQEAGFANAGEGALKDSVVCWSKSGAELCADPASGLPLRGEITLARAEKPPIRLTFKIESFGPKTLSIPSP